MSQTQWVLILGVSSGMGAATARVFARAGYGIIGVHMDRRIAMPAVDALHDDLTSLGVNVHFENGNAASADIREGIIAKIGDMTNNNGISVFLHSLAFGALRPFLATDNRLNQKQMTMTLDVMAHSFVYWTQDLVRAGILKAGGRIFAMTSTGSQVVWPSYGAVSAAKSALESHVRQLALELAPKSITVNAIMAGVTRTPALDKIPGSDKIVAAALARNPSGRLTLTSDVAQAIFALSAEGTHWMTGNTILVDGGETITG